LGNREPDKSVLVTSIGIHLWHGFASRTPEPVDFLKLNFAFSGERKSTFTRGGKQLGLDFVMSPTFREFAPALWLASLLASVLCALGQPVDLLRIPDSGIQPEAVIDGQGTIHLIYYKGEAEGGDVFYVRQAAGQQGFSSPIQINAQSRSAMAIGTIRGAQLALGRNGRVHVAWNGHPPKGQNYLEAPMLYTRLSDSGTAFEAERNVIALARGLDGGGSVAADNQGNVYVMWHAPKPGELAEEDKRAVFVAKSMDDGKTFAPETLAISKPTGACGCCGMKAFADVHGDLFALYRAAWNLTNRGETLLVSHDHGATFGIAYSHGWKVGACPMSSAFLSESSTDVLAAAETHGTVYYVRFNQVSGKVSGPVSPGAKGKYPIAVGNRKGDVLLAWVENTSWGKGGTLAWQIYDGSGNPISPQGKADGVAAWSFVTAVARPSGTFAIIY
jgi:hypothetical protein